MPIEPGASWFSPKCVEAQQLSKFNPKIESPIVYNRLLFLRNKSMERKRGFEKRYGNL